MDDEDRKACSGLQDVNSHKLLFFKSRACALCSRLETHVQQASMPVVRICADKDRQWATEILTYDVDRVPAFVLCNQKGEAIAKSGHPKGFQHMCASLDCLQQMASHPRKRKQCQ
ncbi:hypothetical protein DUNSADRAFT_9480 [Dunaliella salina]|uniref:Glutaredoxin-like protein n=1 Tax=Dunaliella salina TaxID=3046 RepID=A0ABQ7GHA3_DUNSA|nr:hypothetical protein DUNSADRAFT_9480 [Dunaliella salina]|eukprot:KAF5833995.1 hypothetical protein DUNSADRAFT_9480 [Dunaliella salina]